MTQPGSFPSIRCHMGDWAYFVTVLPFSEVASRIYRADEIHTNQGLNDMIQRELTDRVEDIAVYLKTQPDRFFNAIVVGVYGGSPNWYPVDIDERQNEGPFELSQNAREAIGILELSGEERLFAVDGQHRVEGIKIALRDAETLRDEELAVIFVAHRETTVGLLRTRRLFTTLNKYAKPVKKSEIIALDEDEADAIVTRRLVDEYPGLSPSVKTNEEVLSLVRFGTPQIPTSDQHSVTSIETLYDITNVLALPRSAIAEKKIRKHSRPPQGVIDQVYDSQVLFWETLKTFVPPMKEALGSNPEDRIVANYRLEKGGHVLFRPAGQQAFASALRTLLDRGRPLDEAISALSQTVMDLRERPWPSVLWNPDRRNMIVKYKLLAENLLLHMVSQPVRRTKFNLTAEYRKALGDDSASLEDIPRLSW